MLKVQELRELIKLVDQSSIDEFTYEANGATVSMKKSGVRQEVRTVEPVMTEAPAEKPAAPAVEEERKAPVAEAPKKEQNGEKPATESGADYDHEIVSPMVGTLYTAPNPESDSYVQKGSKVEKDSVVCIVEAMKLFNEIEAEVSGEITEILVEDGELVEYGQPLFRVKTK